MIQIHELSKSYGSRKIFDRVSCQMESGRIYALVGMNGIGKTTLLRAITQPEYMDSGQVLIDHIESSIFESKYRLFYVPDSKEMFLNLTGREYLRFIIQLYRQKPEKAEILQRGLMGAFKLDGALDAYIANYSLGMKQKIYMAAALLSGAGNFILDEPFNGLDPESISTLKGILAERRDEGAMILFSVHNLELARGFYDQVIQIDGEHNIMSAKEFNDHRRVSGETKATI